MIDVIWARQKGRDRVLITTLTAYATIDRGCVVEVTYRVRVDAVVSS